MKRRFKSWARQNKPYVIWVSVILIYTFIMLGIIVVIISTDKEGESSFSSRVNKAKETEITSENVTTEDITTEIFSD